MAELNRKVEIVEGLRGIAAFLVVWFHFTNGNPRFLDEGYIKSTGAYGWVGVYIFFVISGFVIPYALYHAHYQIRWDLPRFLGKRLVRLEPPYIIGILISILLWYVSSWMPGFRGSPPDLSFSQIFLHLGYLVPFFDQVWLNPVFWSLAIEFQYYIAIGLIFPLIVSRSNAVRLLTLVTMCLSAYLIREKALLFSYFALFAIGILVFQLYLKLIGITAFFLLSLLVAFVVGVTLGPVTAVAGLLAGYAIAFGGRIRIGSFGYFGAISYSLYLLHVPIGGRVINLGERYAVNDFDKVLTLGGALILSIAAAHLYYRYVECPSRLLSSRIRYADGPERSRLQKSIVT